MSLSLSASAQERLVVYRSFGGLHFEYEKDTAVYQVTPRQVSQILFVHPEASAEFKKARRSSTWSGILGFIGAGLVIVPISTAIAGGDPEWMYAAGGSVLLAGSIPLGIHYRKKALHAIDLFNQRQGRASLAPRPVLYFSGTGLKLVIRF
mgnify:CR=1 FL=1